jgi:hypothetical protein
MIENLNKYIIDSVGGHTNFLEEYKRGLSHRQQPAEAIPEGRCHYQPDDSFFQANPALRLAILIQAPADIKTLSALQEAGIHVISGPSENDWFQQLADWMQLSKRKVA